MVVSPQAFRDITNGFEKSTNGLWTHRGKLVVTGSIDLPDGSIGTADLALYQIADRIGYYQGPAAWSTTNVGSWVETNVQVTATVQYATSWLCFSGHVTLQHTASGVSAYVGIGWDGGVALSFATMQVPAANGVQAFSWHHYFQIAAGAHRFSLFVNNSTAGTLTLSTATNNMASVMEFKR